MIGSRLNDRFQALVRIKNTVFHGLRSWLWSTRFCIMCHVVKAGSFLAVTPWVRIMVLSCQSLRNRGVDHPEAVYPDTAGDAVSAERIGGAAAADKSIAASDSHEPISLPVSLSIGASAWQAARLQLRAQPRTHLTVSGPVSSATRRTTSMQTRENVSTTPHGTPGRTRRTQRRAASRRRREVSQSISGTRWGGI